MSSTTLPVCPKTGSTSPSLTVPLHCSGKSGMRPSSTARAAVLFAVQGCITIDLNPTDDPTHGAQ